ncbi:DnaJ-domain-containing protein [Obba rivulosa]|uniref:DnaJ-domain-containing protein n=1 Tax=Obba rivulosa TaxID=1052685 RepID=A0A8E2DHV4_9APHY|nr:DnaJ-domain-containing protein [Obba rivulosa]
MSTNLYEALGVDKKASPEEIRKAYRKRALQTHPDRLPPTATPEEKKAAEEQFRKINNAYEVLTDESNRKLYDRHGVWPPPELSAEPGPQPSSGFRRNTMDSFGSNPFTSDPFFTSGFGFGPRQHFNFTDPFVLFNSLFGDLHRVFEEDRLFSEPFPSPFGTHSPFGPDPFEPTMMSPFSTRSPFGSFFGPGPSSPLRGFMDATRSSTNTRSYSSVSRSVSMNGQWVSQSKMTRTVNGRTETIDKRRDAQGNEHITYSSPEGERYTINGVEQPSGQSITAPPSQPQASQTRPPPPAMINAPPPPPQPQAAPPQPQASSYYVPPLQPLASNHHTAPQSQRQADAYPGYNYNARPANQQHNSPYTHPAQPAANYAQPPPPPPPPPAPAQAPPMPPQGTYPNSRKDYDRHSSSSHGHSSREVHDAPRRDGVRDAPKGDRRGGRDGLGDSKDRHKDSGRDGRRESTRDRQRDVLRREYKERDYAYPQPTIPAPPPEPDRHARRDGKEHKWWRGGW